MILGGVVLVLTSLEGLTVFLSVTQEMAYYFFFFFSNQK